MGVATDRRVQYEFTSRVDGLLRGLKAGQAQFDKMQGSVQRLEARWQKLKNLKFEILGLAGAAYGVERLVEKFADFEHGLNFINTIARVSTTELKNMGEEIKALSKETGQSTASLETGLYDIYSSFQGTGSKIEILRQSAKAAVAGNTDLTVTGKAVTGVLNAMGLAADQTTDILDKQFKTVELGVLVYRDIVEQQGMFLSTARGAGQDYGDVMGGFALLTKVIGNVSVAATALNQFFLKFKSSDFTETLAKMNIAVSEDGKFRRFIDVLRDVNEQTKNLTDTAKADVINKLIPDAKSQRALLGMLNNFEQLDSMISQTSGHAQGAFASAWEKMSDDERLRLEQMKQRWAVAMVEMGQRLAPLVDDILPKLIGTFERLVDFIVQNWGKVKTALGMAVAIKAFTTLINLGGVLYNAFVVLKGGILAMTVAAEGAGVSLMGLGMIAKGLGFAGLIAGVGMAAVKIYELIKAAYELKKAHDDLENAKKQKKTVKDKYANRMMDAVNTAKGLRNGTLEDKDPAANAEKMRILARAVADMNIQLPAGFDMMSKLMEKTGTAVSPEDAVFALNYVRRVEPQGMKDKFTPKPETPAAAAAASGGGGDSPEDPETVKKKIKVNVVKMYADFFAEGMKGFQENYEKHVKRIGDARYEIERKRYGEEEADLRKLKRDYAEKVRALKRDPNSHPTEFAAARIEMQRLRREIMERYADQDVFNETKYSDERVSVQRREVNVIRRMRTGLLKDLAADESASNEERAAANEELTRRLMDADADKNAALVAGMQSVAGEFKTKTQIMYETGRRLVENLQYEFGQLFGQAMRGEINSFKDFFDAFVDSLLRSWTNAMGQMAAQQLIGGQASFMGGGGMGMGGGGGGLLGMLGSIFGGGGGAAAGAGEVGGFGSALAEGLSFAANGGYFNGTLRQISGALAGGGVGFKKSNWQLFEKGPEAVIPLSNPRAIKPIKDALGGGGSSVVVNNHFSIQALDAPGVEELLMTRGAGVISKLSEHAANTAVKKYAPGSVAENIQNNGVMRNYMR